MSAELAYLSHAYSPVKHRESLPQRPFEVKRGGHKEQESNKSRSLIITLATMAAIVIVVATIVSFVSISLTNAAFVMMMENDAISKQILVEKSNGVSLEMEQTVLSSPSAIKDSAKKMAMSAPAQSEVFALDPDVVAYDNEGDLSLSQTVSNLSKQG